MRVVMVMPCPKCGAEVGYLLCCTTEYNIYTYDGEYDLEDPYIEEEVFKCPECREVVATIESEAKAILGLPRKKEVAA
jgi:predicted RNA-binding Zn-ribbon protein involved in translation (DUF1610 family)